MFGFGRKKSGKSEPPQDGPTATSFVDATGGGWHDAPNKVAADGGEHADYVGTMLERARAHALENNIPIGQEFTFTISGIPTDIVSPHEIMFGILFRASDYGMMAGAMMDETVSLTRFE